MADLDRVLASLPEHEREVVRAWADRVGFQVEDFPPLKQAIEVVAVCALARPMVENGDSIERALDAAALRLGIDRDFERKLRGWAFRAGKIFRDMWR